MSKNQKNALDSFLSGDSVLGEDFKNQVKDIILNCIAAEEKIDALSKNIKAEETLMKLDDARTSISDAIVDLALSTGITKNSDGFKIIDLLTILSDTKTNAKSEKSGSC